MRSGDIRDQSRKLSKIAQNFGRFLALVNLWGRAFQKLYPFYHSRLAARRLKKFHKDTPTSPEETTYPKSERLGEFLLRVMKKVR